MVLKFGLILEKAYYIGLILQLPVLIWCMLSTKWGKVMLQDEKHLNGSEQKPLSIPEIEQTDELKLRNKELAILLEISHTFMRTVDLSAVFQYATDSIARFLDLQSSAIYLLEEDKFKLWATTPPLPPDFPEAFRYASLSDHPHVERTLKFGNDIVIEDTQTAELTPEEKEVCEIRDLRSILYLPLIVDNQSIGVLIVGSTGKLYEFKKQETEACQTIANIAAIAILNARLSQSVKQYTAVLEHEVVVRKRREDQIRENLKEKEALIHEIHHRVRNNFQVILSILNLQKGKIECGYQCDLIRDSQNQIYSMSAIHDQLYEAQDINQIDLAKYITELSAKIFRSFGVSKKRIQCALDCHHITLAVGEAIPLGLVINEMIVNALKYAFPNNAKGKINITVNQTDHGHISVTVADTGIGLADDFDIKTHGRTGIQLINNIIKNQLNGTFEYNNAEGASFCFTFPLDAS